MIKNSARSALVPFVGIVTLVSGCSFQISDGYVFDFRGKTAQKTETGIIDSTVTLIEIKNKFGDLEVAESSAESNWTWNGKAWATDEQDAEMLLSQMEMKVTRDGEKQTWAISLPERSRKLRGVKSNLTVRVPPHVSVLITNEHGNVTESDLSGSTKIDNQHGDVKVSALSGQTTIKNEHGQVVADGLAGATTVFCEHGDIKINGSSEPLFVESEHGDVEIKNQSSDITTVTEHGNAIIESSGANVICNSEHCDVKITVTNAEFQSVVADAEHSDVVLLLPSSVQPRIDLTVDHGNIKSDFQSNEAENAPRVKINTDHGNITVREK